MNLTNLWNCVFIGARGVLGYPFPTDVLNHNVMKIAAADQAEGIAFL